jgi:hypothetical protein
MRIVRKLAHPILLSVAGLACLSAAAFAWNALSPGLVVTGLSLLVLEWRIDR